MKRPPIFIHSLFRTGSTYIWNTFRKNPDYHCYYEPLHQVLADVTRDKLETALTIDFKLVNHPPIEKYYLHEYRDLFNQDEASLPYFKKSFSFDEFCHNDKNPDLKKYIDHLLKGAGAKVPLLQFNRSALRVRWFKDHYPDGLHVYLARNPHDQWASYEHLYKKTNDPTFFIQDLMTASLNQKSEYFGALAHYLSLSELHSTIFEKEYLFYKALLDLFSSRERYLLFYFIWLTAFIENVMNADLLINMNLLSRDPDYRKKILKKIFKQAKVDVDFEDCRITEYEDFLFSKAEMQSVEKKVHGMIARSLGDQRLTEFIAKITPEDREYFDLTTRTFEKSKEEGKDPSRSDQRKKFDQLGRIFQQNLDFSSDEEMICAVNGEEQNVRIDDLERALARKKIEMENLHQEMKKTIDFLSKQENELAGKKQDLKEATERLKEATERHKETGAQLSKATEKLAEKEWFIRELQEQAERRELQLERELREKARRIWEIQNSYAFKIATVMVFPFKRLKSLYEKLKRKQNRRTVRIMFEWKPPEFKPSLKRRQIEEDRYPRKINLSNALEIFYGKHRSGLLYAFESLKPLHNENGVLFDGFIERTFYWSPEGVSPHLQPWIGIIHVPPNVPEWFLSEQSNDTIFTTQAWKESLPFCRGLFTFSEYHKKSLINKLDIPIDVLTFATETPAIKWDPEKFRANPDKKIAQIGWWLRKLHTIFQLDIKGYRKIFIKIAYADVDSLMAIERKILKKARTFDKAMYKTAEIVDFLDNDAYDRLLAENIVIINLYDSSANNLITECMVRNTPLLINPIEPVREYLGDFYPLYFTDLEEAARKAEDFDLILEAHRYLKELPTKAKLTSEHFFRTFVESDIYRSL